MTKTKSEEFLKVSVISALAIMLFGAAFIGINTIAFAASTNAGESFTPVAASVVIPAEQTIPEGFREPTLTVAFSEIERGATTPSANAMSMEEAALIGAQYIWQMFGECIDGHFVDMFYVHAPSRTRAYWRGVVAESEEQLDFSNAREREKYQPLFNFAIDAVTGEWIELFDMNIPFLESDEVREAFINQPRTEGGRPLVATIPMTEQPTGEQLEELIQIAKAHAARHFVGTEVVSAEFFTSGIGDFGLDAYGNLYVASHRFVFEVTDSTGRAADLSICDVTKTLHWITTAHNDIMPGIDIGPRGIG